MHQERFWKGYEWVIESCYTQATGNEKEKSWSNTEAVSGGLWELWFSKRSDQKPGEGWAWSEHWVKGSWSHRVRLTLAEKSRLKKTQWGQVQAKTFRRAWIHTRLGEVMMGVHSGGGTRERNGLGAGRWLCINGTGRHAIWRENGMMIVQRNWRLSGEKDDGLIMLEVGLSPEGQSSSWKHL